MHAMLRRVPVCLLPLMAAIGLLTTATATADSSKSVDGRGQALDGRTVAPIPFASGLHGGMNRNEVSDLLGELDVLHGTNGHFWEFYYISNGLCITVWYDHGKLTDWKASRSRVLPTPEEEKAHGFQQD